MKVLILVGHPRRGSLSEALAQAYREGADQAGAKTRLVFISELAFDPHVRTPSPRTQFLEPDLREVQQAIRWADHLVFVYPTWWGTMPALLKAFFDRVLVPGFAFEECEGGTGFEPRLRGRSAELITTMDTPAWVYRWIMGSPGHRAMRKATLGFCGIAPVRVTSFGPVKGSHNDQRRAWLERARQRGRRLEHGAISRRERAMIKAVIWVKALRLQFYPMTWAAYTLGAVAAAPATAWWLSPIYWLGYLMLFFLEAATVFSNEWFDWESDRQNRYYSTFTGGSRVLVEGHLKRRELRRGILLAVTLCLLLAGAILWTTGSIPLAVTLLALATAALGYTAPPLRLAYRGWGEIDVAVTHSIGVLLVGYLLHGGSWNDPVPWLVSIPLGLAVLPAIVLAGIPDHDADRAAGKRTLAVRLGRHHALRLATALTAAATLTAVLWQALELGRGAFAGIGWGVVPHALLLMAMLYRHRSRGDASPRIDRLIAVALAFILWFVVVPLAHTI